jgi:[ribosomal protein S18]-alanine N-acetyltransferase
VSGEGVRVRVARREDVGEVVALEREVVEAPHWAEGEYVGIVDGAGGAVRRYLLVAERGEVLVGFAVGKVIAGVGGELESVAVAAGKRRAGVGRALCEGVISWCRAEGAAEVELEVRSASRGPISLYESLGFVRVGLRKGYYREPVDDAILMRLGSG